MYTLTYVDTLLKRYVFYYENIDLPVCNTFRLRYDIFTVRGLLVDTLADNLQSMATFRRRLILGWRANNERDTLNNVIVLGLNEFLPTHVPFVNGNIVFSISFFCFCR